MHAVGGGQHMAVIHQHASTHVVLVVLEYSDVPRELSEGSPARDVDWVLDPGQHAARVAAAACVWCVYGPLGRQRVAAAHVGSPTTSNARLVAESTLRTYKHNIQDHAQHRSGDPQTD